MTCDLSFEVISALRLKMQQILNEPVNVSIGVDGCYELEIDFESKKSLFQLTFSERTVSQWPLEVKMFCRWRVHNNKNSGSVEFDENIYLCEDIKFDKYLKKPDFLETVFNPLIDYLNYYPAFMKLGKKLKPRADKIFGADTQYIYKCSIDNVEVPYQAEPMYRHTLTYKLNYDRGIKLILFHNPLELFGIKYTWSCGGQGEKFEDKYIGEGGYLHNIEELEEKLKEKSFLEDICKPVETLKY